VKNDAWLRLREKMRIVLEVHDSLMAVVLEENAEWAVEEMGKALAAPVKWLPGLPVACEVGYARTYGGIVKERFVP
jgi:hypothetical protein